MSKLEWQEPVSTDTWVSVIRSTCGRYQINIWAGTASCWATAPRRSARCLGIFQGDHQVEGAKAAAEAHLVAQEAAPDTANIHGSHIFVDDGADYTVQPLSPQGGGGWDAPEDGAFWSGEPPAKSNTTALRAFLDEVSRSLREYRAIHKGELPPEVKRIRRQIKALKQR